MTKTDKNFKGQLGTEEVLCYFRKHWIQALPSLLTLLALLTLQIVGLVWLPTIRDETRAVHILAVVSSLFILFFMHRQFMAIFHYYLHTVLITNYRIVEIDKSVYFNDSKDSVDLSKIQDIQKRQNGILESIFNFGTLSIVLSGTHTSVELDSVPRPEYFFKKMNMVKQSLQSTSQVKKPDVKGFSIGGIDGTRTRDLLRDRQAL